jgi:hypothetical protein
MHENERAFWGAFWRQTIQMNLVPPPLKPAFFRLKFNDMAKAVLHKRFELSPARAALITGPIVFSLGHGTSLQARLEIAHAFLPSAVVEQNHCHHGKFRSLTDFCRENTPNPIKYGKCKVAA